MNILCPVCGKPLNKAEKTWKCLNGHSFDVAREGYVNLNMHSSQNTGDNQEMVRARQRFLEKGHYSFLRDRINKLLNEDDSLVDLACGEGYYTSRFICKDKVGIDLSKPALKIAAKKDKDTAYILSSIFRCPLKDSSADKVITVFAPIADKEILRILKDEGRFILVRPDERHLFELKERIYDRPYLNEAEEIRIEGLTLEDEIRIEDKAVLNGEEINDLFMMTPYVNTTSPEDKKKIAELDELEISFCFIIDVFKKLS